MASTDVTIGRTKDQTLEKQRCKPRDEDVDLVLSLREDQLCTAICAESLATRKLAVTKYSKSGAAGAPRQLAAPGTFLDVGPLADERVRDHFFKPKTRVGSYSAEKMVRSDYWASQREPRTYGGRGR